MRQRRALQMRNQSLCPVLSAESHHEPKRRTVHDRASTPQAHCPVASRSKAAHAERLRDPYPSSPGLSSPSLLPDQAPPYLCPHSYRNFLLFFNFFSFLFFFFFFLF